MARPDPWPPPVVRQRRGAAAPLATNRMRRTDTPARTSARRIEPRSGTVWVDGWALAPYLGAAWRDGLTVAPRHDMVPRASTARSAERAGLLGALANPLYRSGYALIANVAGTTVVGLGFWAVAAHLYSSQRVGQASALVAALVVVSSFAQLNLNNTLPRFLTQAGRRAGRLIGYGYAASSVAAVVIGLALVVLLPKLGPHWHFVETSFLLKAAFVAATVVWGVFALQDSALLGLQRPMIVPVENTVYGVAKLLTLLGVASMLPETGVFIAWIIPLAINVPAVNWLIFRRYLKDWKPATAVSTVRPRDIIRFTSVDYVGNLFSQTAGNLLPLLVLTALGAAADASFYIAWTITTGLNLVATSFATSLLVEGSANPSRLRELTRGVVARNLMVTVAGAAVFALGARLILSIYGHGYAVHASLLLGLLAVGSVFYGLLAIVFSVDRIVGRVGRATVTRVVLAIATLTGSWVLLPRMGINGVGFAWLGANLVVALARMPTILSATRLRADAARANAAAGTALVRGESPRATNGVGRHRRGTPSPTAQERQVRRPRAQNPTQMPERSRTPVVRRAQWIDDRDPRPRPLQAPPRGQAAHGPFQPQPRSADPPRRADRQEPRPARLPFADPDSARWADPRRSTRRQ